VSNVSNGALASPLDALDARDGVTVLGGVLVDIVDGDLKVLYRRPQRRLAARGAARRRTRRSPG
jgi:hypothetical protein